METLAGTVILALLLFSVTEAPEGAALERVTVQVDEPGAFTVPGEQVSDEIVLGAFAESVKLCDPPFKLAVMSAV